LGAFVGMVVTPRGLAIEVADTRQCAAGALALASPRRD